MITTIKLNQHTFNTHNSIQKHSKNILEWHIWHENWTRKKKSFSISSFVCALLRAVVCGISMWGERIGKNSKNKNVNCSNTFSSPNAERRRNYDIIWGLSCFAIYVSKPTNCRQMHTSQRWTWKYVKLIMKAEWHSLAGEVELNSLAYRSSKWGEIKYFTLIELDMRAHHEDKLYGSRKKRESKFTKLKNING